MNLPTVFSECSIGLTLTFVSTRQEQFSGTRDVREADQPDIDALNDYLQAHIEGYSGPLKLKQFKGGQSNPTYLLQTPNGEYVMRRKPSGKLLKSAHAVDREFRVMSALHAAGFPVPRMYLLCEDESIVGTMFFGLADSMLSLDFQHQNKGDCESSSFECVHSPVTGGNS